MLRLSNLNGMVIKDGPLGWSKFTAYYHSEKQLLSMIDFDYVPGYSFVHKPFISCTQPYIIQEFWLLAWLKATVVAIVYWTACIRHRGTANSRGEPPL